jgi:hypothetical protein
VERRGRVPLQSDPSLTKEARMARSTKSLSDSDDKIDTAAADGRDMARVVVTVDHVYLPLDEDGNGRADWAVTTVETTRVSKRERLQVPADLAKHLSQRDQAEIL